LLLQWGENPTRENFQQQHPTTNIEHPMRSRAEGEIFENEAEEKSV